MTAEYGEHESQANLEWVKIGNVKFMTFVGRDIVAFGVGCYIVLFNVTTLEETVYVANNEEKGEGVQCLVGYQQAYMFAFAEMTPCPRVFLIKHPEQEIVCTLQDQKLSHTYICMSFAEMECLVCVTGMPNFEIVVWCWRTGEKLASQPTGITYLNQQLRCSVSMPIGVSQLAKHENDSIFQLWQVNICSKLCLLTKANFSKGGLEPNTKVSAFCWSPEGTLMIADTIGNLYLVSQELQCYQKVQKWPYRLQKNGSVYPTNILWHKNGVIMSGPNGFIQFIKRISNTEFQPGWCITNEGPLLVIAVNRYRDIFVGWSQKHSLVKVNAADQSASLDEMKHYGAPVRLLALIHPADKLLATVNNASTLDVWDKETGEKINSLDLERKFVLDMRCNPLIPYLALGRSDGVLQLVASSQDEIYSLTELALCSEEITGVAFNNAGTLIVAASFKIGRIFITQGLVGTGNKINVLNHLLTNDPIVNIHVVHITGEEYKLLVLINRKSTSCPGGNELIIYSLPKLVEERNISFEIYYSDIICVNHFLLAAPHISNQFHVFKTLDVFESEMADYEAVNSGHKIRKIYIYKSRNHILTYGWDGSLKLRTDDGFKTFCDVIAHHRFDHGVICATVDYNAKYIISLGKEGNLVCNKVLTKCPHIPEEHKVDCTNEFYFQSRVVSRTVTRTQTRHFTTVPGSTKTWLETQIQQKLNMEQSVAAPEINNILTYFKELQSELVQLLDDNFKAPPDEQLDILEFDLDKEAREELLAEAATERDNVRRLMEAECLDCERLAEVIKKNTWDTMEIKSRCIKAMLDDFSVDNYGHLPCPPSVEVERIWELEARKLSTEMGQSDHFEPWFPFPVDRSAKLTILDSEPSRSSLKDTRVEVESKSDAKSVEVEEEKENPYLFFGSSSYQFVDINPLHCSQFEINTCFNSVTENVMLRKICDDLRSYFNKLFDDMFNAKEREMALLADRNARLRTILSELQITCNAPMDVSEPEDAEWSQEEKTERIVTIEDSEVPETPYISPSEQDLLDKKAAEEERIRKLLAADNFRELALIEMMDGMLEVRWEDELKKEVPKPKCMLEKDPENYNEADLKAIKEYEEKCKNLSSEREKYRKMLETEYKKLEQTIQESLTRFDNSLFELFQTRLKIDAACQHEQLKMLRIFQLSDDRIRREKQEIEIANKVTATEKESETAHRQVTLMQEATNECRNNYEALVLKDKALAKKFKLEFANTNATPAIVEQLVKYFRRRPKLQQRATLYPTLLLELARCVAEFDNTSFLPPDFHEFITALEQLDSPTSAGTSNFDENVWSTLIRVRRVKIESELKVKAWALALKEAEVTLSVVIKQMKSAKEQASSNVAELKAAKEEKLRLSRDLQVQLVMKQGLVEAPLTGHISDFEHSVLINPKIVENINQHVRAAGARKLDAMKQVTKYHRINKYKEWEYKKMKMECEDLEDQLDAIENIKVTLEVKQYLKDFHKPKERDAQDEDLIFLKQVEDSYKAAVQNIKDEISTVEAKIKHFKKLNAKADQSILDLKCDVSEQQFERDLEREQSVSEHSRHRMALIVKRSQLVARIQQVHNDNLVLQTELELLRLRTYPTLKYKAPI